MTKIVIDHRNWRRYDKSYHEDIKVVESYDRRITKKFKLEHKYFTLGRWLEKLKKTGAKLILDFGCGTGTVTLDLLKSGFQVISVDASLRMLRTVDNKVKENGLKSQCLCCDVEKLPLREKTFDGLLCMGVLHHVPHISKAIKEQIRVLKSGGLLFITEPYRHKPWISCIYYLLLNTVKFFFKIFKKEEEKTYERLLKEKHIDLILGNLRKAQFTCEVQYLIYWPVLGGYLPEKLAYPLFLFLNKFRVFQGKERRGDFVVITAQKAVFPNG